MNHAKRAIALVAPEASTRDRLRYALHGLGPKIEVLDTADLITELGAGRSFAMLVLALQGGVAPMRSDLDHIQTFTAGQTPLMLLLGLAQVEAVTSVMTGARNDYLLMPVSDDELIDRLASLYFCWSWPQTGLHCYLSMNRCKSGTETQPN